MLDPMKANNKRFSYEIEKAHQDVLRKVEIVVSKFINEKASSCEIENFTKHIMNIFEEQSQLYLKDFKINQTNINANNYQYYNTFFNFSSYLNQYYQPFFYMQPFLQFSFYQIPSNPFYIPILPQNMFLQPVRTDICLPTRNREKKKQRKASSRHVKYRNNTNKNLLYDESTNLSQKAQSNQQQSQFFKQNDQFQQNQFFKADNQRLNQQINQLQENLSNQQTYSKQQSQFFKQNDQFQQNQFFKADNQRLNQQINQLQENLSNQQTYSKQQNQLFKQNDQKLNQQQQSQFINQIDLAQQNQFFKQTNSQQQNQLLKLNNQQLNHHTNQQTNPFQKSQFNYQWQPKKYNTFKFEPSTNKLSNLQYISQVNQKKDSQQQNQHLKEFHQQTDLPQIEKYFEKKKELYESILRFLDNSEEGIQMKENEFHEIQQLIDNEKYELHEEETNHILQMINNISKNHHRTHNFIDKIIKILQHIKEGVKKTMSNDQIFDIFQDNKIILLHLFKNDIITMSDNIYSIILNKIEPNGTCFCHFFYPEIKSFIGECQITKDIEKKLLSENSNIFDNFEEKRKIGENDSYICSLIRNDSIEEFIAYSNRINLPLTSEIKQSIFETNSFLIENEPTLIEYSAFYGSIQIFQYLKFNNVELTSSIWLYAIHSQNAELIHLLERSIIEEQNKINFVEYYIESIKCHHNDFADYIENNLLPNDFDIEKNDDIISAAFQYYNYNHFKFTSIGDIEFFNLCFNNYHSLVEIYLKSNERIIEEVLIYILKHIYLSHLIAKDLNLISKSNI